MVKSLFHLTGTWQIDIAHFYCNIIQIGLTQFNFSFEFYIFMHNVNELRIKVNAISDGQIIIMKLKSRGFVSFYKNQIFHLIETLIY